MGVVSYLAAWCVVVACVHVYGGEGACSGSQVRSICRLLQRGHGRALCTATGNSYTCFTVDGLGDYNIEHLHALVGACLGSMLG